MKVTPKHDKKVVPFDKSEFSKFLTLTPQTCPKWQCPAAKDLILMQLVQAKILQIK